MVQGWEMPRGSTMGNSVLLKWEMLHEMGDATQDGRCHMAMRLEVAQCPEMGGFTPSQDATQSGTCCPVPVWEMLHGPKIRDADIPEMGDATWS